MPLGKSVVAYSEDGTIQQFPSAGRAAWALKLSSRCIYNAIQRGSKYKGFRWGYEGEPLKVKPKKERKTLRQIAEQVPTQPKPKQQRKGRTVIATASLVDGKWLQFPSVAQAARKLNIKESLIRKAIQRRYRSYGLYWFYAEDKQP